MDTNRDPAFSELSRNDPAVAAVIAWSGEDQHATAEGIAEAPHHDLGGRGARVLHEGS
jgi:hypothetical protein